MDYKSVAITGAYECPKATCPPDSSPRLQINSESAANSGTTRTLRGSHIKCNRSFSGPPQCICKIRRSRDNGRGHISTSMSGSTPLGRRTRVAECLSFSVCIQPRSTALRMRRSRTSFNERAPLQQPRQVVPNRTGWDRPMMTAARPFSRGLAGLLVFCIPQIRSRRYFHI